MPPEYPTLPPATSFLLNKRLLFFVGKGGVGKTTVSVGVALAFARQGKKTLLIEFDENTRAVRLLGLSPGSPQQKEPHPVSPSLFVLSTSGTMALEEYLRLIIPVSSLRRAIVESRAYQYFVAAAPGLKELLTMGKVWYEERKQDPHTQKPLWDILLVDLPATGHSLQYLRMPHAAHETFGGVVGYEAERILTLLRDTQKTAINLVTTPDELAVSETEEAYRLIINDLRLPLGTLFINRTHSAPLSPHEIGRIKISSHASTADRRVAALALQYGQDEAALALAQAERLHPLAKLPLPTFRLPFCSTENFDASTVEQLSYVICPDDSTAEINQPTKKNLGKKREPRRTTHERARTEI